MARDAHHTPRLLRFKFIHWYLIPLVALVVWWGMLIALLSAWSLQGRPIYGFMNGVKQNPVYISDVGATNLQPLFISCTGFQAIFFVGTLVLEYVLRTKKKLQPYVSQKQPPFAITSIVCATIGQLGILFVAIFNTVSFHNVHFSMVGLFIAFSFLACLFNFFNSFIFGNFPDRLTPNHERVFFGAHRWANLYMVSFFMKLVWLVCAVIFAICFGSFMKAGDDSSSARFEWLISFWYGLLLVMWGVDLFPSAVKHYQIRHPEMYPAYDKHTGTYVGNASAGEVPQEKFDQRSTSTDSDHGTYVNQQPVESNNLINTHLSGTNAYQQPQQHYRGPVESGPTQDTPNNNASRYTPGTRPQLEGTDGNVDLANSPNHITGPAYAKGYESGAHPQLDAADANEGLSNTPHHITGPAYAQGYETGAQETEYPSPVINRHHHVTDV